MIEKYLNDITNLENYIDCIIVTNENAEIIYIHYFKPEYSLSDEKITLGKNILEVYPLLKPEESTIIQALKYGKITLNKQQYLTTFYGTSFEISNSTFPIKEENKIIGAVNISIYSGKIPSRNPIEVYNKTEVINNFENFTVADIIGRCDEIQELRNQVQKIAKTSSSVLIYGSTGTGKELVAQSIHSASDRKNKPFISQNCAAIPATLLESIFFGTSKGAFTGAENTKGIFESANGGTIFLDEVNSMDINLQAKLLRVLEQKYVTKIGNTKKIPIDVRIVATTNKKPTDCIKDGTIRDDLFYRLGSVTIEIPDLKDRGDDIELLTEYFISNYNTCMHKNIIGISQEVMAIFKNYSWPGNVREFRNVIEGAFNLCEGVIITKNNLPSYIISALNIENVLGITNTIENNIKWMGSLKRNMDEYEKTLIVDAIKKNNSLSAAARYLGITRQSLYKKIQKYNLRNTH